MRGPLGLWIPREYAENHVDDDEPAAARSWATTVGWAELFGSAASQGDLIDRIRRYSLREITILTARVCLLLEVGARHLRARGDFRGRPEALLHATQDLLLQSFLGREAATQLWEHVRSVRGSKYKAGRVAFFQERQALNLLKLALIVTEHDAPDSGEGSVPFLEALLMLHDALDPNMSGMDTTTGDGRERWELYMFAASSYYNGRHDLHDQVRAHYLYIEPPAAVAARNGVVDLPAMLERATGLPSVTAWNAIFGVYAAWGSGNLEQLIGGAVTESRSRFFATLSGVTAEERDRWFSLTTIDVRELQQRVRDRYSLEDPHYFDVLVFEQTPVIMFDDTLICVSLRLLKLLGTVGLQHRFLDPCFSKDEREAFLVTRGYAVEQYVLDLLERAFGPRLVGERRLRELAVGRKVCEAIAIYADAAILFEVKAIHPTLGARHGEDYDSLRRSWERHTQNAADQLESTISLLKHGALREAGLDPDRIRRVYPIVVTFESPMSVPVYRAVRDIDLKGHPLMERIASRAAAPLTLMDIYDIEMLEVALEHGAEALSLLQEKTAHPEHVELPFDDYLRLRGEPYVGRHSHWHAERFQSISDDRRQFFRERGLPTDAATGQGTAAVEG